MYGTLFKRYNSVSRKFVKLTRESVSDRRNIKETADGAGTYENSEREVSGGLSEDKISDIRYSIDDTKQEEVDFRKALTREEWASFYSSLNKYNQRDNLKMSSVYNFNDIYMIDNVFHKTCSSPKHHCPHPLEEFFTKKGSLYYIQRKDKGDNLNDIIEYDTFSKNSFKYFKKNAKIMCFIYI